MRILNKKGVLQKNSGMCTLHKNEGYTYGKSIQMAALSIRNHSSNSSLVPTLFFELSRFRRNDDQTRFICRSHTAKRFFRKVLGRSNITPPRVINVDKNAAYIGAVNDLKKEKLLSEKCKRRPTKYMNNIVEQDHRFIKCRVNPGLGFGSYPTAWRTIQGYETMNMIRKGQIEGTEKGNIAAQNQFIAGLFGLTA